MPIIRNIPLRHELKYHITPAELGVLRGVLRPHHPAQTKTTLSVPARPRRR